MAWNFELVSGPFKGRTGGLAWDGSGMLFSAVGEERIMRYDPKSNETGQFRWWTGRANGIAVANDGSVFGAQEGGRRVVHYLNDGTAVQTQDLLDGAHHNQPVDVQVDLGTGLIESVDELVVAQTVQSRGGADACDPQATELTLLLATIAVGEDQRAVDLLTRDAIAVVLG